MHLRSLLPLTFVTLTGLACALTGSGIEVVATPVALPATSTPAATQDATPTAVIAPAITPAPPLSGFADVYVSRNARGGLTLHYADPATSQELAAVNVDSERVMLSGESVFFAGEGSIPTHASADGNHTPYENARPDEDGDYYDFAFSVDGSTMVWLNMKSGDESNTATISAGWTYRDAVLDVYVEEVPSGVTLRLVSLSADGSLLTYDRREATGVQDSVFPAYADLWALDIASGEVTQLPGEPGCERELACDAHVSEDGRTLVRSTQTNEDEPRAIVVYNLATGQQVASFPATPSDEEAAHRAGYPFLSQDKRQLVYTLAEGPDGAETYRYFRADIASEEQEFLAESALLLRPVRWLDDETLVLSAEPGAYDEWHLSTTSGELRRVSDRLYLGQVLLP